MSWAEEDWTVGLSGRVLLKVKELQVQHDRLSRESKQRQLQLDNSQDALNKQKIKHEEVRRELQILQRELKGVQEEAQVQGSSAERLSLELQTKQSQVCSLEGQLDAARTLTQNLTLEVKRLEAELEKLHTSQEASLYSTPCWNTTSPWEHNTGKQQQEDRTGQRGDAESRHVRQQLQFSDTPTGPAPRHASRGTPHQRHSSDQSEAFPSPGGAFPWEREDSRPASRGRCQAPAPQAPAAGPPGAGRPQQRDHGRTEHASPASDASVSELRGRVSALEAELRAEADRLKASQEQLGRSQKELATAEANLQKSRDQISGAQTRTLQESDRASAAEQKVKKLQEELKCQRQNAESSRLQHQQRTKELEKQHQMDVSELQKERQRLERQHQQEVTKLNQELQQARVLHNTLQAQAEKLSLQKQALEREVDTLKAKLKWTEGQLQESEKKNTQTQAKLTEALRDAQGVAASLEQSTRRGKSLEEEGQRVTQERDDALRLIKELREQNAALAVPVAPLQHCSLGQSFSPPEPRPSGPSRKPPGEQRREPGREQARGRQAAPQYPTDREPGEGIDAEHMAATSPASESPQQSGKPREEELIMSSSSGPGKVHAVSQPHASLLPAEATAAATTEAPRERDANAAALRKENAALSSELRDAREELERRLEDLEAQRRAEAEARTRLKQLSKKRAGREAELEEQERGRRAELESERAETERLRRALAALQAQLSSKDQEKEKEEEEEEEEAQGREDREQELTELNIQMKAQLSEARAQLALEREERQREEEERKKGEVTGEDEKVEKVALAVRLAELEAELEELRSRGEKNSGPLTYLALRHDDELNANMAALCRGLDGDHGDDDHQSLLASPERSRLLCHAANQLNAAASLTTAGLILKGDQGEGLLDILSDEASWMEGTSPDPEDSTSEELSAAPAHPDTPTEPAGEVERLRVEKTRMAQRAEQCQAKLEALQSQVTRQTQQLTMAFDLQTKHITGLLAELQEKERVLHNQGGELERCRQELARLTAETAAREEEESESVPAGPAAGADGSPALHAAASASQPSSRDTDALEASGHPDPPRHSAPGSAAEGGEASTDTGPPPVCSELGRQGDDGGTAQLTSPRPELLPGGAGLVEDEPPASDAAGQEPCTAGSGSPEEEGERQGGTPRGGSSRGVQEVTVSRDGGVNIEDTGRHRKEQDSLAHLEKQLVALQIELRTVSEEKEKQAAELVLWRLASLPTPAPGLQEHSLDLKDQTQSLEGSLRQPESSQAPKGAVEVEGEAPALGAEDPEVPLDLQQERGTLTLIREDQVLLSCSSRKLQGTMLTCRLQRGDLTEPKSVWDAEKVPAGTADLMDDEGSDKENMDTNPAAAKLPSSSAASQRASHDQRRAPKDATRAPPQPHAKATPGAEDEAAPGTAAGAKQREACGRPSRRSAATQTHAAPQTHAATQTAGAAEHQEGAVVAAAAAAVGEGPPLPSSFPIPADPARLAERILRNRSQLSAAFDDTEYEPYGLPEVVMMGFADIPSGPACPYIVRRGLLGTPAVPLPHSDTPPKEETD